MCMYLQSCLDTGRRVMWTLKSMFYNWIVGRPLRRDDTRIEMRSVPNYKLVLTGVLRFVPRVIDYDINDM